MTALFGAPHFPAPHHKGAGFSPRRPGSGADFGRGPSPRPGANRRLRQTHPQRVKESSERDSLESLGKQRGPEAKLLRLANQSSGRLSPLGHGLPIGGMRGGYARELRTPNELFRYQGAREREGGREGERERERETEIERERDRMRERERESLNRGLRP